MATRSYHGKSIVLVAACRRVRYLWPHNWIPLLPVPIGWFDCRRGECGLGVACLCVQLSVVVKVRRIQRREFPGGE
jgi:hypothetical protein